MSLLVSLPFSLAVLNILWHKQELTVRVRGAHDALRQNPFTEANLRRFGTLIDFGLGDDVVLVGAGLASADGNADTGSALTIDKKRSSGGFAFSPIGQNKWTGYGTDDIRWESLTEQQRMQTEYGSVQAAIDTRG